MRMSTLGLNAYIGMWQIVAYVCMAFLYAHYTHYFINKHFNVLQIKWYLPFFDYNACIYLAVFKIKDLPTKAP